MIMQKQSNGSYSEIGFIKTKNGDNIDKILGKNGEIYFEQGFTREISGVPPFTLNSIGKPLKNYEISGNTIQNNAPSPDNPIAVQSVGDLITKGEFAGKYKIPVIIANQSHETVTTNIYLSEPLRKIGNYADELNFKNNSVTRKIKKIIFDGSEDWSPQFKNHKLTYVHLKINGVINHIECTHYPKASISVNNENMGCGIQHKTDINADVIIFRPPNVENYDIDSWKYYLAEQYAAGTPVTVWYVLTNEETETVNFPEIPTLKGATIVKIDTEIQPSDVKIIYKSI